MINIDMADYSPSASEMIIVECARKAPCLQNRRNIKFLPQTTPASRGPAWVRIPGNSGEEGLALAQLFSKQLSIASTQSCSRTRNSAHPRNWSTPLPLSQIIYKNTLLATRLCLKLGLPPQLLPLTLAFQQYK